MIIRSPTPADITTLLEGFGCSNEVIYNVVRSIDLVETFLELKSFERVAALYISEYQFFENHVLRDEVHFVNFYNGLLETVKISEEVELKNEDTYDDSGSEYEN